MKRLLLRKGFLDSGKIKTKRHRWSEFYLTRSTDQSLGRICGRKIVNSLGSVWQATIHLRSLCSPYRAESRPSGNAGIQQALPSLHNREASGAGLRNRLRLPSEWVSRVTPKLAQAMAFLACLAHCCVSFRDLVIPKISLFLYNMNCKFGKLTGYQIWYD